MGIPQVEKEYGAGLTSGYNKDCRRRNYAIVCAICLIIAYSFFIPPTIDMERFFYGPTVFALFFCCDLVICGR